MLKSEFKFQILLIILEINKGLICFLIYLKQISKDFFNNLFILLLSVVTKNSNVASNGNKPKEEN